MLRKVALKRSESGTHHVFRKFGQSLPVRISKTDLVSKSAFPFVSFSDWLKYLVQYDELQLLVGERDLPKIRQLLGSFWEKYRHCNPEHVIYTRSKDTWEYTIPVFHHGDEGRGLKKKQLMVLSTHGVLGGGSLKSNHLHHHNDIATDPLKMNMVSNTITTHFLFCVMPVELYNETPSAFYQMLELQAREFAELFDQGILIQGVRFYISCIGVKGDAPYLTKAGQFNRAFTHRPTRPSSRSACSGICHLCLAGKEDHDFPVPFEQYGVEHPAWLSTVGLYKPFIEESPLFQIPFRVHGTDEAFFHFDLFHNWHSGLGKNFASSAICVCMELIDATIDKAFEIISADFKDYCGRKGESPYHKKITSTLLGVNQGFLSCPEASWSKGDFTRLILQWFGDYCQRKVIGCTEEPLYLKCAEAVSAINACLSGLYREGLFIPALRAAQLGRQGLLFLRLYTDLAGICFRNKQKRFPLMPKGHYLHHQFLSLVHQANHGEWALNIVAFAVQLQEDYIGKPSRLARRVSSKTTSLRVIERTFLAMRGALGLSDGIDDEE
eukprot:Skav202943  [mRNA]  locus=scaffold422:291058:292847:+ [translate_table: standard]